MRLRSTRVTCISGAARATDPFGTLIAPAAAVFSLRRIVPGHTGPAIRVRRSSDNAEANIGFTATGDLDSAALLSFSGASSAYVSIWYDASGNGRHANQPVASYQPRIVAAGSVDLLGGKAALNFSGVGTFLQIGGIGWCNSAAGEFSAFSVFRRRNPVAANGCVWSNRGATGSGGSGRGMRSMLAATQYFHTNRPSPASVSSANEVDYVHSVIVGQTANHRLNCVDSVPAVATAYNASEQEYCIGRMGPLNADFLTGLIAEIVFYDAAISAFGRLFIERNQGAYFSNAVA